MNLVCIVFEDIKLLNFRYLWFMLNICFTFLGVSSRSQVSLELSPVTSTVSDADGSPAEWSAKSVGTSTVGTR